MSFLLTQCIMTEYNSYLSFLQPWTFQQWLWRPVAIVIQDHSSSSNVLFCPQQKDGQSIDVLQFHGSIATDTVVHQSPHLTWFFHCTILTKIEHNCTVTVQTVHNLPKTLSRLSVRKEEHVVCVSIDLLSLFSFCPADHLSWVLADELSRVEVFFGLKTICWYSRGLKPSTGCTVQSVHKIQTARGSWRSLHRN